MLAPLRIVAAPARCRLCWGFCYASKAGTIAEQCINGFRSGYRIDFRGRPVAISGDTAPSDINRRSVVALLQL